MPWQPLWVARLQDGPPINGTDANCSYGVHWVYAALNDCVWNSQGIASVILGLVSILTWMLVSLPQMYKNCRNIRGVESISLLLILMWTLGDTANLIGSILTKQLPFQIYLAIYFVFADLVLFSQWLYYKLCWKKRHKGYEEILPNGLANGPSHVVLCVAGTFVLSLHGSLYMLSSQQSYGPAMPHIRHPAGRSLMSNNLGYHIPVYLFHNLEDKVGYAIGLISSVFYTFSRVGQMVKNYKRKSTEGLSMLMFILAVLGNLTYGLSIIVRQLDSTYILKHLPWLIGSLGVVLLDISLLVQFWYYSGRDFNTLAKQPVDVDDEEVTLDVSVHPRGTIN